MEKLDNENKKRICEYWLQMESCRQCLFDVLCNLKKQNERCSKKDT